MQPEIMNVLHKKDFALVLDSPDVANSPWVRAEILEAFAQRIPLCSVRVNKADTRNHRCQTMEELLDLTFDWFETRTHFRVQPSVYKKCPGK